jgi:predicted ATPase/type II secretory pathway predicted ATPase ExeA
VGRLVELQALRGCLAEASAGRRQVVFLTGEPGIGKTTVVQAFLAELAGRRDVRIAYGQCVEHYGAGEAYLPLMQALTDLGRRADGAALVRLLRRLAPGWLVQMPSLVGTAERVSLQRRVSGATSERMLRELAEALDGATRDVALVLCLEDLHWSDASTLDALACLARRPGPARLLVLGSYRPAEVLDRAHPLPALRAELGVHGLCRELSLPPLDEAAVAEYVGRRFPRAASGEGLGGAIHRRTGGNPLLVAQVCDELVRTGIVVEHAGRWEVAGRPDEVPIPADVDRLIGLHLDRLSALDRRILEAGSVAGSEFSSLAAAAGAEVAADVAESRCADLVRREVFLVARGAEEWAGGPVSGRYAFRHALLREAVYSRVPPAVRAGLHRRIGLRLEAALEAGAGEAAALAMHFELGRDADRAIRHRLQAGRIATERGAAREAVAHLTRALEMLAAQPDRAARVEEEIAIRIALGAPLMAIKGRGAPDVEEVYLQAQALCERVGDTPPLFPALWGLFLFRRSRGEIAAALDLGDRLLALAGRGDDAGLLLQAHHALWATRFAQGELVAAREHAERGRAIYDADRHAALAGLYGNHDAGVCALAHGAWALALLGEPEAASRSGADAIALARALGHRFSEAHALLYAARVDQLHGDWPAARARVEAASTVVREGGFAQLAAWADVMGGWALVQAGECDEGLAAAQRGIAALAASGSRDFMTYFLGLLAETWLGAGRPRAALDATDEGLALVERCGERFYEAELLRVRGRALRAAGLDAVAADGSFRSALAIARRQQAGALERRVLADLAGVAPAP